MRVAIAICFVLVLAGCTCSHGVSPRPSPVFIRVHGEAAADSRWPQGIEPPPWYEESDDTINESAGAGGATASIEAVLVKWESVETLRECQRMFRLGRIDDTEFGLIGDRKKQGILTGGWTDCCLIPPTVTLREGQSSFVACCTAARGVVLFVKLTNVSNDAARLCVSAQATQRQSQEPPHGYRLPCLTVEDVQVMQIGQWYMKLAESEDPRSPTALMVRIRKASPPGT